MCICKYSKLKELRSSSDMIADKSLSNMLQRTIQVRVLSWLLCCYGFCDNSLITLKRYCLGLT